MTLQIYPCSSGRIFETWERHLPYCNTFQNHEIITPWRRSHFKKCKVYTFHYSNILSYFRNL